ncbi:calcium-binding protein [Pseudooceanicola nanhaiensis]|uniref:calcium-binding protein n=1 Tax=Pseudooceanicola nanhaiensis TaxID=375761 RepID=UPI001CD47364|nr:calcium-binding protein [Pseudooceanicola nanhaiensis]MCA0919631.1 hypothetical protein [Pseudooceanicola nanhaiensis]
MTLTFIGIDSDGFDVAASGDMVVVIETGRLSNSGFADAFDFQALSNVNLVVQGSIFSEDADGVSSDSGSSGHKITVDAGGSIIAGSDGIELFGADHKIANAGFIRGVSDAGVQIIGDAASVTNTGQIFGARGIVIDGQGGYVSNAGIIQTDGSTGTVGIDAAGTATIVNSGTVSATRTGVRFSGDDNTLINTGLITGGNLVAVQGSFGADTILNSGEIVGDVTLDEGNDVFDGRGGIVQGTVFGGAGDDTFIVDDSAMSLSELDDEGLDTVQSVVSFTLSDNIENLTLLGSEDIDGGGNKSKNLLIGNAGDNMLSGDGSVDTIDGGLGQDTLDGGRGNDKLNGDAGDDVLMGRVGSDTLNGGDGDDLLQGGRGSDTLKGDDGNDTLNGGLGTDEMTGGEGLDVFVFNRAAVSTNATPDQILDFTVGEDLLNLSGVIDGTFDIVLLGSFPGTGPSIRTSEQAAGNTIVRVDIDGDGASDMRIDLLGTVGLTEADFLL